MRDTQTLDGSTKHKSETKEANQRKKIFIKCTVKSAGDPSERSKASSSFILLLAQIGENPIDHRFRHPVIRSKAVAVIERELQQRAPRIFDLNALSQQKAIMKEAKKSSDDGTL